MNLSSLLMAMNCQPSSIRIFASSTLKQWMPAGDLRAFLQVARMCFIACLVASPRAACRPCVAHARGQVVGADEDGVDAGHGEDRVGVLDRLDVLALEDDEHFVVGLGVVVGGGGAEVEGVDAAADASGCRAADRAGGDGVLGLLRGC